MAMMTSMIRGLPYAPRLHPVNARSVHHLKYALDDLVAPGDIDMANGTPASVAACRLLGGGVMLLATIGGATAVRHERHHLSQLDSDDVIATIVLEGSGRMRQCGIELPFSEGDVVYRKASQPSAVQVEQACRLLLLRFSFSRFNAGHLSRFSDFVPSLALRGSPLREALWAYIHQVLPSLGGSSVNTIAHAEQAFVSLLSAVYAESQQSQASAAQPCSRWEVLASTVEAMMCEPDLSVAQLAKAIGISPRLVHRVFELNGHRYSAYLLEKRLQRVRADLCNPRYSALSVSEIAYRAGFNNASHFSRSFKQRYGAAPSSYRSSELARA
jgi:AraC-like DNA-binding protein